MILRSPLPSSIRSFCSTSRVYAHVSHIGKVPIALPPNVSVVPAPTLLTVKGPLGETSVPLESYMHLSFPDPKTLALAIEDPEVKKQRSMWGLTRTLISNAVVGMTEGFSVPLYLVGVGYRVILEDDPKGTSKGGSGKRLNLKVGHSHSIMVPIPPHIKAEVPTTTKIVLHCTDKQKLGLFAAEIRRLRKPEPYKGKGIFIGNEQIRIKAIKKK